MSTAKTYLDGLLSLLEADAEVALIPPGQTFVANITAAKTGLQRVAAVAKLEGDVLAAGAGVGPEVLAQVAPSINAALQAELTKALATQAAGAPAA